MTNPMPTFAVYAHRSFLGYVNAVSLQQARRRARKLHGAYVSVELAVNVPTRAADRTLANVVEHGKRNVRYPTQGFEARRAALIAEFKANA